MSGAVTFPVFLTVWNRTQSQGTPGLHLRMARWLERRLARRRPAPAVAGIPVER